MSDFGIPRYILADRTPPPRQPGSCPPRLPLTQLRGAFLLIKSEGASPRKLLSIDQDLEQTVALLRWRRTRDYSVVSIFGSERTPPSAQRRFYKPVHCSRIKDRQHNAEKWGSWEVIMLKYGEHRHVN